MLQNNLRHLESFFCLKIFDHRELLLAGNQAG